MKAEEVIDLGSYHLGPYDVKITRGPYEGKEEDCICEPTPGCTAYYFYVNGEIDPILVYPLCDEVRDEQVSFRTGRL